MTQAKQQFDKTIARCEDLIGVYEEIKRLHESEATAITPSQDILRGAIVLAVAAFDAYATDCFSEKFIDYIKRFKVDDSLKLLLEDAGFDISFALNLINSERPYRKIRTLITKYYARYTTQRLDVIDQLFLQYHLKNITKMAAQRSGNSRLLNSVNKIVGRRHDIVHNGDYNDHNKIKAVSDRDIKRIGYLKTLVENMDAIIENKFQ